MREESERHTHSLSHTLLGLPFSVVTIDETYRSQSLFLPFHSQVHYIVRDGQRPPTHWSTHSHSLYLSLPLFSSLLLSLLLYLFAAMRCHSRSFGSFRSGHSSEFADKGRWWLLSAFPTLSSSFTLSV